MVRTHSVPPHRPRWLRTHATAILKETTSEGSGYFSIVEGRDGKLYIGTAKYGSNAYLVEFDPVLRSQRVVVDAHRAIGTVARGFAAQAKFHTRNHVGESGRIYLGTKQGYPMPGESRDAYPGGYPMVYDPRTGRTRVYPIPIPGHGIISVVPDESRGVAYVSTCDDARPVESTHFLILDLKTGAYRDLLDCRHLYAFVVVDLRGRAYHPVAGGRIARFDPQRREVEIIGQSIDGEAPSPDSHLADAIPHPLNWEVSPDRRTLYCVAMSGNQLFAYDLRGDATSIRGRTLGPLVTDAVSTDCRALCVAKDGSVWMGVAATFPDGRTFLHLVGFRPGRDKRPRDCGPLAIDNPDYTPFTDERGATLPWHHGVATESDGTRVPRYVVMGICATRREVHCTTLYPFTLHTIKRPF